MTNNQGQLIDFLNSSSDSYVLYDEQNPRQSGRSRALFPRNSSLVECVSMLKFRLKRATRRANVNHAQLQSSIRRNNDLTEYLKRKEAEMAKIANETKQVMNEMEESYDQLQSEKDEIERRLKMKKTQLKEANQRNEQLEARVRSLIAELDKMKTERDEMKTERDKIRTEKDEMVQKHVEQTNKYNEQIAKLSTDISAMTSNFIEYKSYLKENEHVLEIIGRLKDSTGPDGEEFEQFKMKVLPTLQHRDGKSLDLFLQATHTHIKESKNKWDETDRKAKDLESNLKERNAKYASLLKQYETLRNDYAQSQEKWKQDKAYIQGLNATIEEQDQRLQMYKFAESDQYARLCQQFDKELIECFELVVLIVSKVNCIYHNNNNVQDSENLKNVSRLKFNLSSEPRCVLDEDYLKKRLVEMYHLKEGTVFLKAILDLYN